MVVWDRKEEKNYVACMDSRIAHTQVRLGSRWTPYWAKDPLQRVQPLGFICGVTHDMGSNPKRLHNKLLHSDL